MLQAEYVRDMHNNYLVLKGIERSISGYGVKMLLNNKIKGLLTAEQRCIDHTELFYYDITSKKSIGSLYENKCLNYNEITYLLSNLIHTIDDSREYLLLENDFMIAPEFVYIDIVTQSIYLCHLVGHEENIQEQLSKFVEYLMNKVDYKDERAVLLIYAIYKVSREEDCTFDKLLQELEKKYGDKVAINQEKTQTGDKKDGNLEEDIQNKTQKEKRINSITAEENTKKPIKMEKNELVGSALKHIVSKSKEIKYNKILKRPTRNNSDKNSGSKNSNKSNSNKSNSNKSNSNKNNSNKNNSNKNSSNKNSSINNIEEDNIIPKLLPYPLQEEVESEREIYFYETKIYMLAGILVAVGIIILIIAGKLKLLHNSFGTKPDVVKIICGIIIMVCLEVFLFAKLFDKNNRMTKMVTKVEYIDQFCEEENQATIKRWDKDERVEENLIREEDETRLLWTKDCDEEQDKTIILAHLVQQQQYYLEPNEPDQNIPISISAFPFIVGKSLKSVDFIIEDSSVSRFHAKFTKENEKIYLTDLGSTNGTFINSVRLLGDKPYQLASNDEITFSEIKYIWKKGEK